MSTIKPIYLLADSQLLFWREEGVPFLERIRKMIEDEGTSEEIRAAYIGASNDDAPEFYELFVAAMHEAGIKTTRHIPAHLESEDRAFLREAELILLAGGDVRRGWQAFEKNGLKEKLIERYYAGAVLMGVSAGAVQLGLKGWDDDGTLFDTFRVVPFVVDVHEEPQWTRLNSVVPRAGEHIRGFGIPSGGGAIYHPDYSMEPVRHPMVEVSINEEGQVRQALVFPGETAEADEQERGTFSPEIQSLLEN